MTEPELLLDEADWHYYTSGDRDRSGRLRVWRDTDGRLVAMVTIRDRNLNDERCVLPEQIRDRFPGERIEFIAYEPTWWGGYERYYRAVFSDCACRWEEISGSFLAELFPPAFTIDDDEGLPGSDPDF